MERRKWREGKGVKGREGGERREGGSIKTKQMHKDFGVCKLTSEWPGSLAPNPRAGNCLSLEK